MCDRKYIQKGKDATAKLRQGWSRQADFGIEGARGDAKGKRVAHPGAEGYNLCSNYTLFKMEFQEVSQINETQEIYLKEEDFI